MEIPAAPLPELRFRRRMSLFGSVGDLAKARELLFALAGRGLQARYAQTLLGMTWALVTPVLLTLVFVVFVQRVAHVDTGGAPYALFAYLGLLPWSFFSTSVAVGGGILVAEASVLNKVRCPREVFPLAEVIVAAYDFAVSLLVLLALFIITGYEPRTTIVWAPVLLLVLIAFTVGVTLAMSVVIVYLRDLGQALPLMLQLGLFATPVAYGVDVVPYDLQPVYALLNPLVGVIEGLRQTVLLGHAPPARLLGPSAIGAAVVLLGGYHLFKRLEAGIADVA